MFINKLNLINFKCFDKTSIDLSKITLLTGQNSSGKSSILYGILGAAQSLFPLYFSPNGKYINMGDFYEICFGHDQSKSFQINISLAENNDQYNYQTTWVCEPATGLPKLSALKIQTNTYNLTINLNGDYHIKFIPNVEKLNDTISGTYKFITSYLDIQSGEIDKQDKEKFAQILQSMKTEIENPSKIIDFHVQTLDEIQNNLIKMGYPLTALTIFTLFQDFKRIESNMNFISSFRNQPERTYYRIAGAETKIGKYGENTIDQIANWKSSSSNKFKDLVSILRKLNLLNTVAIRKLSGGRFEIRIAVKSGGVSASLPDVGFGISQIFPIIVADLQLDKNSTLLVAQPEIHIHPSVQASLADYFIEQTNRNGKRYILETHSEYMLNHFRAAITKGKITPEEVSVYYFENSINGAETYKINFTKNGRIEGAPKEFFDTYMIDVMDIAMNA